VCNDKTLIPTFIIRSNATSINSIATEAGPTSIGHGTDSLDSKIECLLRDWHHSPDLLFAVHPIDGSFLIWYELSSCLAIQPPPTFEVASLTILTGLLSG